MTKKFILLILFLLVSLLPTIANPNWVQVDDKIYVDTNSLRKENYGNYYSLWTKNLNNGSKFFLDSENYNNKKIGYSLIQGYYDCNSKRSALKSVVDYDLTGVIAIWSHTYEDYNLLYESIAPGTVGEALYNYACTGKF